MDHTAYEARFERIEATLETLAKAQLRGEQAHSEDFTLLKRAQLRAEYALTDAVEEMARSQKQLLTSQVLMFDEMGKLAAAQTKLSEAQAKTEERLDHLTATVDQLAGSMDTLALKSAETQGKLDALIHMWDDMIRERGKNGHPPPAAS